MWLGHRTNEAEAVLAAARWVVEVVSDWASNAEDSEDAKQDFQDARQDAGLYDKEDSP